MLVIQVATLRAGFIQQSLLHSDFLNYLLAVFGTISFPVYQSENAEMHIILILAMLLQDSLNYNQILTMYWVAPMSLLSDSSDPS